MSTRKLADGGSERRLRPTQRPLFGAAIVSGLALAVVLALPGTAAVGGQDTLPAPVYRLPQSYYLALGDSITYGFQPNTAKLGASRARVANIFAVFNPPGNVRTQQARLCSLTFFCSKGDPHPTDAGYRAMADAFMAASGYPRKP